MQFTFLYTRHLKWSMQFESSIVSRPSEFQGFWAEVRPGGTVRIRESGIKTRVNALSPAKP